MAKPMPRILLLVALLAVSLAACAKPVYNVEAFPVSVNISFETMEKAILLAGMRRGWRMVVVAPGTIEGQLFVRKAMALVEIPFDQTQFSIYYKDSSGLTSRNGKIHRKYNKWVRTLEQDIDRQIVRSS